MFKPFSKSSTLQVAHPLMPIWAAISALQTELEGQTRKLEQEATSMAGELQLRLDQLRAASMQLSKRRVAVVEEYRSGSSLLSSIEEELFLTKLERIDEEIQKKNEAVDETTLRQFFPAAKGFIWHLAVPGVFVGMHDFWVERFSVKSFSLELSPGRGAAWESGTPPSCTFVAGGIALSIHVDELGLRGEKVPSTLHSVRQLELVVEAELYCPLAFELPKEAKNAEKPSVVGKPGRMPHSSVNKLLAFRWRVLDRFKFEVTKLDVKTKGTGIAGVPAPLLKYLINAFVPLQIKAAVQAAVPAELGILLALHSDHRVSFTGEIVVQSLPLGVLNAPLDGPAESTSQPSSSAAPHLDVNSVLSQIVQTHKDMLAKADSGRPLAAITQHENRIYAAGALGLTPIQARTFVAAQAAVPVLKGVAPLRTLHDVLRFVALHNPASRFRVSQRAAHQSHASSTSKFNAVSDGKSSPEHRHWTELVAQWQRLLDEYVHLDLARAYDQVSF
jgi:hypothetical protein